jgi:hypothetical protein
VTTDGKELCSQIPAFDVGFIARAFHRIAAPTSSPASAAAIGVDRLLFFHPILFSK